MEEVIRCMVRPCVARRSFDLAASGLASMYPASVWSVWYSRPSWISARIRSHYRLSLDGLFGSPVFGCAGKTVLHLVSSSRRPRRVKGSQGLHRLSPYYWSSSSLVCAGGRSFVPACTAIAAARRHRQGWPSGHSPGLDDSEHGGRLRQVGTKAHRSSSRLRSRAPWPAPPRRCGRACWPAQSPTHCGAAVSLRPRSKP